MGCYAYFLSEKNIGETLTDIINPGCLCFI